MGHCVIGLMIPLHFLADDTATDGTADGRERFTSAAAELVADHAAGNRTDDRAGNLMLVVRLALFGHGLIRAHATRPGDCRHADDAGVLGITAFRRPGRSDFVAIVRGSLSGR